MQYFHLYYAKPYFYPHIELSRCNRWRIPWGIPLRLLASPVGGRLILLWFICKFAGIRAYVHILSNRWSSNFPFQSLPPFSSAAQYWVLLTQHQPIRYALDMSWQSKLAKDEKIIESNEWKCGRNTGTFLGARCFKLWLPIVLTLVMSFRGLNAWLDKNWGYISEPNEVSNEGNDSDNWYNKICEGK